MVNILIFSYFKNHSCPFLYNCQLCHTISIFYKCSNSFCDAKFAVLFGLAGLQVSPIYDLFGWPALIIVNFIILGVLTWLKGRINWIVIFIVGSILFHGAINAFYNLLPLLYLKEISDGKIPVTKFIIVYILCFVSGFFIMNAITYLLSGSFLVIPDSRRPHYIKQFTDIFSNIKIEFLYFKNCINIFNLKLLSLLTTIVFLFGILNSLANKKLKIFVNNIKYFLIISTAAISAFVEALPLGIFVGLRTAISLFASIILLPLIVSQKHKFFMLIFIAVITSSLYVKNYNSIIHYNMVTSILYKNLKLIPVQAELTNLYFIATNEQMLLVENMLKEMHNTSNHVSEFLGNAFRFRSTAFEAGFGDVKIKWEENNTLNPNIPKWLLLAEQKGVFSENQLYKWKLVNNWLILDFNWPQ